MRLELTLCCGLLMIFAGTAISTPTFSSPPAIEAATWCARPAAGSAVVEPHELKSANGRLELTLTIENHREANGTVRYCYRSGDGSVSPTLRVKPGDWLILKLDNQLSDLSGRPMGHAAHSASRADNDPCKSGAMSARFTNLHFHGLAVPATCHQDEVLKTSIAPASMPFEYRIHIPLAQPAGLYWYHPHMHGFSAEQVSGGASGALIVEGLERSIPEVANLPERVIIIRDQPLQQPDASPAPPDPSATPFVDRDGDAVNTGSGFGRPARDLSVNFVPVAYPDYQTATIAMRPGERQLWRVLNASSVTYLNLAMVWSRGHWRRVQFMGLVAVDGIPLNDRGSPEPSFQWREGLLIPPGGRVEIMVNAPLEGTRAELVTRYVDTGPAGENDPNRPLVSILTQTDAPEPKTRVPAKSARPTTTPLQWVGSVTPARPLDPDSALLHAYAVKHDPFAYFRSIQEASVPGSGLSNILPFEGSRGLYADLATGHVPALSYIVPNQCDDQHGQDNADAFCQEDQGVTVKVGGQSYTGNTFGTQAGLNPGLALQADTTLERIVKAIHESPAWHETHSAIVIVWDESDYAGVANPLPHGTTYPIQLQNRVPLIVEPNRHEVGVQSQHFYDSFSLLKSLEAAFGLRCLNHACDAGVDVMSDLFGD